MTSVGILTLTFLDSLKVQDMYQKPMLYHRSQVLTTKSKTV